MNEEQTVDTSAVNNNTNDGVVDNTISAKTDLGSVQTPVQESTSTENGEQKQDTPEKSVGQENTKKSEPLAYDWGKWISEDVQLDEKNAEDFTKAFNDANLTQEQVDKIMPLASKFFENGQQEIIKQATNIIRDEFLKEVDTWGANAKKEIGADYDNVLNTAAVGVSYFEKTIPGIRKALDETGAGNRVEIIRAFEQVGKMVGEDRDKLAGQNIAPTDKFQPKEFYESIKINK